MGAEKLKKTKYLPTYNKYACITVKMCTSKTVINFTLRTKISN